MAQRPCRNGSSNSTTEVLVVLTTIGASALTILALWPRRSRKPSAPPEDVEQEKDEGDDAEK